MSSNVPVVATSDPKAFWFPGALGGVGFFSAVAFGTVGIVLGVPMMIAGGALGYRIWQKQQSAAFEHQALRILRQVGDGEVTRSDLVVHMNLNPEQAEKTLTWLVSHDLMVVDYSAEEEAMVYRCKTARRAPRGNDFDREMAEAGVSSTEQRELAALDAATSARAQARRDREAAAELERQRRAEDAAREAEALAKEAEKERQEAAKAAQQAFDARLAANARADAERAAKAKASKPAARPAPTFDVPPVSEAPGSDAAAFDTAAFDTAAFDAAFGKPAAEKSAGSAGAKPAESKRDGPTDAFDAAFFGKKDD